MAHQKFDYEQYLLDEYKRERQEPAYFLLPEGKRVLMPCIYRGNKDAFVDDWLSFQNKEILKTAGTISNKRMEQIVDAVYEDFNQRRKLYAAQQDDKNDEEELKTLELEISSRKK